MTTAAIIVTERIAQIVANDPDNNMLRISVEGGGCSGFEYRFDLVSNAEPEDMLIERQGPGRLPIAHLPGGLGDRLCRRSDECIVQDQEPKCDSCLRLRHELLLLRAMFPPRKTFPLSLLEQPH